MTSKQDIAVEIQILTVNASGIEIIALPETPLDIERGHLAYVVRLNGRLAGTDADGHLCYEGDAGFITNNFTYSAALWLALVIQTLRLAEEMAKVDKKSKKWWK